MYHDQGLPVLKHAGFGEAVNVTLGLPIIRTSVDHGTALDLAGTGSADAGSLVAALTLAAEFAQRRAASRVLSRMRAAASPSASTSSTTATSSARSSTRSTRARRALRRDRPGPRRAHHAAAGESCASSTSSRSTARSPTSSSAASAAPGLDRAPRRCAEVRLRQHLGARRARCALVGNLPYNISTPLLFHLLDHHELFRDLHVMLQREVVERMTAKPGTARLRPPDRGARRALPGRAAVPRQARLLHAAAAGGLRRRAAGARRRRWPRASPIPAAFDRVLMRAFSMRRKRLANALKGLLTEADIRACGMDPACAPAW